MKNQLLKTILLFFIGTFFMSAQSIICGGSFTDPAGVNANYADNSSVTTTICASNPTDYVTVTFNSFALESNYDFLKVYDGNSASAPLIASFSGSTIPNPISSSVPGGCLTFVFTSDNIVNAAGWDATVSCSSDIPLTCPTPNGLLVSSTSGSPVVTWAAGNATQWEVAQLPSGTSPSATTVGTVVTTNSYQVTGNSNSIVLVYVRAICSSTMTSYWSAPVTATIPTLCAAPTLSPPSGITTNSANLSWSNTINTTSWQYAVQLSTVTTAPVTGIITNSNTNNLVTGLLPGTAYRYYVRTDCGGGNYSPWSSVYQFTTLGLPLTTPVCGGTFMDNGGLNAYYNNNTDSTVTIYPANPGDVVTVTFTSFDTETSWDGLYIFNGNSISAPQISSSNPAGSVPGGVPGAFWGTTIPGPFTSTSADGSLTFRFRSDPSVNRAGWQANVTCGPAPTCPAPNQLITSGTTFTSTSINWHETGLATQWEVIVLPATSPAPTENSVGTMVNNTSTYLASNLTLGTAYKAYIRSICSSTDFSTWSSLSFSTLSCVNPTGFSVSNITATSAFINYSNTTGAAVQVIIAPSGTPAPTANSTGFLVTSNGYAATGLTCATSYVVYVRSICNNTTTSAWASAINFTTTTCVITTGHANNMTDCSDASQACFNLTDNNLPILANLSPLEYTINYYSTLSNATSQTSALSSPYCVANGVYTIYAVLVNNTTLAHQTLQFTISSQNVSSTTALANLEQCDEDYDGFVIFNLTNQVTTTNPVSYYLSLANATSQINPIANPAAYSISSISPSVTIFVRESIISACDPIYSFELHAYSNCNLAHNCGQANPLCGSLGVPFPNTHQGIHADAGNAYGCLASTPNPTWFYLPVSTAGNINLTIQQNSSIDFTGTSLDVDYIVYGPFSNPVTPCSTAFTQSDIVSCSFSGNSIEHPVIANAQVGQYYLLMTTNYSNQAGFITITMDPTSQGAIDCSGLRLNAFLDTNNNGSQDTGESNFPLGQFHYDVNSGSAHNVTSPTGLYTIYDINPANTYNASYTIDSSYTSMYALSTSAYSNLHVVTGAGVTTYNFPVTSLQNYDDLAITIIPMTSPRAGFIYKNKIVYANLGSQTMTGGTVNFTADAGTTITSVSQSGTTTTSNGFSYNFTNLMPFEIRTITVTMSVPPIPAVTIGQSLTNTASIYPTVDDIVLSNNTNSSTQTIIASYDPNDKTESHGDRILYSSFTSNDYLFYTIRFENTGTASAVNVHVEDVLDSKLDETSIKMVSASHNYILDRVGSNLTWKFNNIQLPVSVADTEIGKGYVTFKVKMKPGFSIDDIVQNTASIYFDNNPAIITNTFTTQFYSLLNNSDFNTLDFLLYPNPTSHFVQISLPNSAEMINNVTFYDVLGKSIKTVNSISESQLSIDISEMQKGVYFVEIQTENKTKMIKKLIIK